jgi:tRNA (guanine-N7-)-methyltransferase
MAHKKLIRFEELKTFPNVLQFPENMQGKWDEFFQNKNPIILELACGKGEYAVGLGRLYSNKNLIGVDVKGNRIWKGAKIALTEKLSNVAFLRTQIDQLTNYFSADEVSEIWITFPDPQLRFSKMKKRLTHPKFLRLYKSILQQDGIVHLKTDSPDLYNFTKTVINLYQLKIVDDKDDLYKNNKISEALKIKTHYESLDIAQSNKVHYLAFKLNNNFSKEKDEVLKNLFREEAIK